MFFFNLKSLDVLYFDTKEQISNIQLHGVANNIEYVILIIINYIFL